MTSPPRPPWTENWKTVPSGQFGGCTSVSILKQPTELQRKKFDLCTRAWCTRGHIRWSSTCCFRRSRHRHGTVLRMCRPAPQARWDRILVSLARRHTCRCHSRWSPGPNRTRSTSGTSRACRLNSNKRTHRENKYDVTSVGQRSSPWAVNKISSPMQAPFSLCAI